ncbi:hypothetical protein F4777DRAFT_583760 [Nemania sp. FL0916]|nr:hypothetical protein F4777DRAFT_583760 [Nemania sp. FL0916]
MPPSGRTLTKWDAKVHEDILVALSNTLELSGVQWDSVINTLHQDGYTFTKSALMQHLQKLKKKDGDSAPTTPKSDKTPRKKNATPASGRKRSAANALEEDDEDEKKKVKLEKHESNGLDHDALNDASEA